MPITREGGYVTDTEVLTARDWYEFDARQVRVMWPHRRGKSARELIRVTISKMRVAKLKLYGEEE